MSIKHYIGVYAELKLNETYLVKRHKLECKNNHVLEEKEIHFELKQSYLFCSQCGADVLEIETTHYEYPRTIYDIFDNQEWEDELDVITPPSLFGTGNMFVISNKTNFYWLRLDNYSNDCQVKDMPTNDEVEEMKRQFMIRHCEILDALQESEHIQDVAIKFGYVINEEY